MRPRPGHEFESDTALMARVEAGDAAAFGTLYDRHAARAFRAARATCGSPAGAAEAVHVGFMTIWRGHAPDRGGSSFRVWSMTIVQDCAVEVRRRTDPTRRDTIPVSAQDLVLTSLERLPDPQAQVIGLASYGNVPVHEIAVHLGLPARTVGALLRRGMETLCQDIRDGEEILRDSASGP